MIPEWAKAERLESGLEGLATPIPELEDPFFGNLRFKKHQSAIPLPAKINKT
jgi:hypothetical protein